MIEDLVKNLLKYALEGAAVAVAAYYIPKRKVDLREIAMIAATAAVVFLLLDTFAPSIGEGARLGSGFGIGANQAGFAMEGMCGGNEKSDKKEGLDKSDKFDY
jgi:hypothetical protein